MILSQDIVNQQKSMETTPKKCGKRQERPHATLGSREDALIIPIHSEFMEATLVQV